MNGPVAMAPPPMIPPKVAAAQEWLRFAEMARTPPASPFGGEPGQPRDLTRKEQAVCDAALEVMRLYFTGEQEFGGGGAAPPAPGDDPDRRVPVNV